MDVSPDFEGMSGIGDLMEVAGALLMAALIIAVLMVGPEPRMIRSPSFYGPP